MASLVADRHIARQWYVDFVTLTFDLLTLHMALSDGENISTKFNVRTKIRSKVAVHFMTKQCEIWWPLFDLETTSPFACHGEYQLLIFNDFSFLNKTPACNTQRCVTWPYDLDLWPFNSKSLLYCGTRFTGCVKIKRPNKKNTISQKCVNIFASNLARLFST